MRCSSWRTARRTRGAPPRPCSAAAGRESAGRRHSRRQLGSWCEDSVKTLHALGLRKGTFGSFAARCLCVVPEAWSEGQLRRALWWLPPHRNAPQSCCHSTGCARQTKMLCPDAPGACTGLCVTFARACARARGAGARAQAGRHGNRRAFRLPHVRAAHQQRPPHGHAVRTPPTAFAGLHGCGRAEAVSRVRSGVASMYSGSRAAEVLAARRMYVSSCEAL